MSRLYVKNRKYPATKTSFCLSCEYWVLKIPQFKRSIHIANSSVWWNIGTRISMYSMSLSTSKYQLWVFNSANFQLNALEFKWHYCVKILPEFRIQTTAVLVKLITAHMISQIDGQNWHCLLLSFSHMKIFWVNNPFELCNLIFHKLTRKLVNDRKTRFQMFLHI